MYLFGLSWDKKRTAVAFTAGVAGFFGSFFSFNLLFPPHTISFPWSLFLPLLVSLAYGRRYALVAALAGGAGLFPFFLWPTNGWANLLVAAVYVSWFVAQGSASDRRRVRVFFWNNMYLVQFLCSLCYVTLFVVFFTRLFSFNPPFWYPTAPSSIPRNIVMAIAIKQVIEMFSLLFICDLLLNTRSVPRMLGLPVLSSNRLTSRIVLAAASVGIAVIGVYFTLEAAFVEPDTSKFLEHVATPEHIRTSALIMMLCMFAGMQLAKFMRTRIENEEQYRTLYESAGDAIFIMQGDRFVDCNPRTLAMFGCSRDRILGSSPIRFSPALQSDGRTSEESAREKIAAALAGNQQYFEWKHVRYDGTPFDAEVSLNRIDLGAGDHLQAIVRDVSERKAAEDRLRDSEQKLKLILDHSPFAGYVLSTEGKGLYVNKASEIISGYDSHELLGKDFLELIHPEDLEQQLKRREARQAGEPIAQNGLFRIIDKSGTVHWVENHVIMMQWEGQPAALGYLWDVTGRRKAEEELQIRAQLLDGASDSIFLLEADGRIVYANEIAYRSRGYRSDEILKLNIRDLVPAENRERVSQRFSEIFRKGSVLFEATHCRKDSSRFPVEITARSFALSGRQFILSSVRDVTERKEAEAAIRESEARFRGLIEKAPVAISISRDGKTIYVNQKYLQVYGFQSIDELVGRPIFDQWAPETRELVRERSLKRARGEPVPSEYEGAGQRKDGSSFPVHIVVETVTLPDGPAFMAFLSDITERRRAEEERETLIAEIRGALEAVSRSQKEWQNTFDSITDMISIHDRDFNVIRANKAFSAFVGLPPSEVVNRKCHELMHHGAASSLVGCPHQRTMQEGVPVTDEVFDERTKRTFRVSTYPYYAPAGDIVGSIHISRDITEEKEREMGLIMTERLASLGQMASGIAHEINNPLESVMICAEMLLMQVGKDHYEHAQFEKYLKIIDEEVMRCRDITGNMLSFSRQSVHEQTDIDAHLLLDKAIDLVRYQGRLKSVSVMKKYGEKLLLRGNEGELRQVFLAIVVNALDAMGNKGTLTVESGTREGSAWIRISDTGPGVPKEILDKIFQPFFTTKLGKGGTGLGLSIAHRIIENHHGSLSVSSEPGHGSAFTVTLPF